MLVHEKPAESCHAKHEKDRLKAVFLSRSYGRMPALKQHLRYASWPTAFLSAVLATKASVGHGLVGLPETFSPGGQLRLSSPPAQGLLCPTLERAPREQAAVLHST
jgi:hypothetical protein